MGASLEFWAVVPEEAQNLKVNPSMEFDSGLTGYTAVGSSTLSRSTVAARRGLYSAFVNVGTVSERGIRSTDTYAVSAGQTLTFSCDVLGSVGAIYRVQILNSGTTTVLATTQFTGTGRWQRKSVSYYCDAYITTNVRVTRYSGGVNFYTDGWMVKLGEDNLYFDGDSRGWLRGTVEYRWNGVAHNSSSWRSGNCRKGGRLVRIKDFAQIRRVAGLSLANHDLASVELVQGGEMYQGARPQARIWSMEMVFNASNELDLLKKVRMISTALDPRAVVNDEQPVLLLAKWVDDLNGEDLSELLEIPSVYVAGLSGSMTSPVSYQTTVSFKAHDPLLLKNSDSATSLLTLQTFTGYSLIRRDRYGVWGPWGITAISSGTSEVRDFVVAPDGTVYACGTWNSLNGSASMANIAKWTEAAGWQPLGSGLNNSVYKLLLGSDGKLYAFGTFTTAGGVPNANRCAVWDGSSWSAIGGVIGANSTIYDACWTGDGRLWVVGKFTTIGGVSAARIAVWDGSSWSALGSGLSGGLNEVYAVVPNLSRTGVMAGGEFDTAGGLSIQALAEWDGTWKAVGTAYLDGVYTLFNRGDGRVLVGGRFTISGCKNIAAWNGSGWDRIGGGLSGVVRRIAQDEFGLILTGSFTLAYGGGTSASPRPIVLADGIARWMQTQFAAFEADLPDLCYAVCRNSLNGDLYLGFIGSGTVLMQASTSVTLTGYQRAYPVFRLVGPGKIWNITNLTTGKRIDFDALTLQTGEVVVLACGPNGLCMYSTWRGDMSEYLMPTSNQDFALDVGQNDILAYIYGNTGVTTALVMTWQDGYRAIEGSVW